MNKMKKAIVKFGKLPLDVKIVFTVFFLFFVVEAAIQLYPFLWVINNSLRSSRAISDYPMGVTKEWLFRNYIDVFRVFRGPGDASYFTMLSNSLWQTCVLLFVQTASSTLVAYNLAKFRFPGRSFLYWLMIFIQTIPIFGTGAAAYKLKDALGMINNPWTIWISWANGFSYTTFILYGSFLSISRSYAEAAELDGASETQILLNVMLPQVMPAIVAMIITNFVGSWNNFALSQISLNKYPSLAYGLLAFEKMGLYGDTRGIYYATLILTALPGVLLYSCFQNLIINNVRLGGLKG